MFGQESLFDTHGDGRSVLLRFWVSANGRRHPATASLALAVARARAAAIGGHKVVIVAVDGTAAVVTRSPNGNGFVVISYGPGSWPDQCRRLLEEHG